VRAGSLCLAITASIIGLVFPYLLAARATGLNQSVLLVMIFGIAGAFIHGAGFTPSNRAVKLLISPYVTWVSILGPLGMLIAIRQW
jgi:predicted membrane protein